MLLNLKVFALSPTFPPHRYEGEGQGGGVDKERASKAGTPIVPEHIGSVAKRQGGGVDKVRVGEASACRTSLRP